MRIIYKKIILASSIILVGCQTAPKEPIVIKQFSPVILPAYSSEKCPEFVKPKDGYDYSFKLALVENKKVWVKCSDLNNQKDTLILDLKNMIDKLTSPKKD